jgi:aminopeptidase N
MFLRVLIFLCLLGLDAHFAVAQTTIIECKQVDDIARSEMRIAQKKQMAQYYKKTASEWIDVHYHRCEWMIDPAIQSISGLVTTYFTAKTDASQVVLDLTNNMLVDEVRRNGKLLSFQQKDNTVIIDLGFLLPRNSMDSLSIQYHGNPNTSGFGSFNRSNHAGVPVLWTLSEPYGARDWWPCKNTLDDKIDSIDIIITCPKAYKGISNGLRQSEQLSADGLFITTHWKHRYPMVSYLVCLAVTNYTEFNNEIQLGNVTLPMQTFCYPENLEDFKKGTYAAMEAMLLFHKTFGDYPFIQEKYGHTQFSWGGGEEHQTNSFMVNVGESLSAHELAHQWFGDKITCGSWQDIWLNEGFATHLASMYMEAKYPDSAIVWRKRAINQITQDSTGSVKVDDTLNVGRIFSSRLSYIKGSHLLYMLRFKLGDEAFFKAIKAYQNDPQLVHSFAKTSDLKRNLEKSSGLPLDSFFRQWFEGQGYPSYSVQWAQIGNATVKIKVNQSTAHSSVPFFEMPLALQFKNASKQKTVIVDCRYKGEVFIKEIGFIADTVFVDPDSWLISRNNNSEKLQDIEPNKHNVVIYPNPFQDQFSILINHFKSAQITIDLYDAAGKKVFEQVYALFRGKGFIIIPTQQLAIGRYTLKLSDGSNESSTISLLKK